MKILVDKLPYNYDECPFTEVCPRKDTNMCSLYYHNYNGDECFYFKVHNTNIKRIK